MQAREELQVLKEALFNANQEGRIGKERDDVESKILEATNLIIKDKVWWFAKHHPHWADTIIMWPLQEVLDDLSKNGPLERQMQVKQKQFFPQAYFPEKCKAISACPEMLNFCFEFAY
jgi:hypothetical protein